ncbi:unnamed protein product [Phaedon cochleariae]|uniref:MADF domain-containing protein n=1 Tax=Phaedon cochleariae TaxID=80249 RepID=A0A9P0DPY3_PHACE|nr:unnamed protein product [Phaedon cochleariae]
MQSYPVFDKKYQYTWSREGTTVLIELYENYPCLYISTLPEYHNKDIKHAAYVAIKEEFNRRTLANLTPEDIKKKIHGIRTQYLNELNKIKKSKASGAGTKDIYKPTLWCFDALSYLNPSTEVVNKGESNLNLPENGENSVQTENSIDIEYDDNADNEILYDGYASDLNEIHLELNKKSNPCSSQNEDIISQEPVQPVNTPKRRRKADKIENLLDMASKSLISLTEKENVIPNILGEQNQLFGKMIASEMNTIEDESILDALKQKMLCSLYEAKNLNRQKKQ